jgi:cytochrome c oxidase assembly protein subunit 15
VAPRGLAVIAAGFTLLLILAGGFVTSTGSGDAIPTWPLSWGRLAPVDGTPAVWIEQNHRYLAGIVGLLVGVLMVWIRTTEDRAWVRMWAHVAFGAVVVQALIGGLRIFSPESRAAIAIVHAVFAQVVFGSLVALSLFLSPSWRKPEENDGAAQARRIGVLTVAFAFLQLIAGAVTRHTGAGIAVHLVGAGLVLLHATVFASRLMTTRLQAGAHFLMFLLAVQVILGLTAWAAVGDGATRALDVPIGRLVTVTAHVAVGAMVLATTLVLTLRCHHSAVAPRQASEHRSAGAAQQVAEAK